MIAPVLGDSGTPLWTGAWKVDYDGTMVYLIIADDLTGYVCPFVQGPVQSVATLTEGKVTDEGKTYTAIWGATTPQPSEGDTAAFELKRTAPTKFKGTVTWTDGLSLPFDGEWVGPVKPQDTE